MKKTVLTICSMLMVLSFSAHAKGFNYVSKDTFKTWLKTGKKMMICDIQPEEGFKKHHFKNAIETNAYPAKTGEDLAKLHKFMAAAKKGSEDIVIICPRGKGGAKRTYSYLKEMNIPEKRLYILEGGAEGWPYDDLVEKSN